MSSSTSVDPGDVSLALDRVRELSAVPAGDLSEVPDVKALFGVVDRLVAAGQFEGAPERSEAFEMIEEARVAARGPAQAILSMALLRSCDRGLPGRDWSRLAIRRCDWTGHPAALSIPKLQVDLAISGGRVTPGSLRSGEKPILSFEGTIGVLAQEQDTALDGQPASADPDELFGELRAEMTKGFIRLAAFGAASCLLTDQRLIAVLFDAGGSRAAGERDAVLPLAEVTPTSSTVLLLVAERDQFESCEFQQPGRRLFARRAQDRLPAFNLLGCEGDLHLRPSQLIDSSSPFWRLRRHQLQDAVEEFVATA